jgi:hypothetical protein
MTFQLNHDITELMKEIVSNWVLLHYDYIHEQLVEKEYTDEDEVRDFVLFEYFNGEERHFGDITRTI